MHIYLLKYYSKTYSTPHTDIMLELVRISVGIKYACKKLIFKGCIVKVLVFRTRSRAIVFCRSTNRVLTLITEMTFLGQSQKSLLDDGKIKSHPVIYSLPRVNGEFGKGPF